MQQSGTRFLLMFLAVCCGFIGESGAVPSVRVLGSGAGYSEARKPAGLTMAKTTAKTASVQPTKVSTSSMPQTAARVGAAKTASARMGTPKTVTAPSVAQAASNRGGLTLTPQVSTTKANTERFPGIATKANIQNVSKLGTLATSGQIATSSGGGYNIKEMDERLTGIEDVLEGKVDSLTLSDYYTKDYIDETYYTRNAIDDLKAEILDEFSLSPSYDFINNVSSQLGYLGAQVEILKEQGILDLTTNSRKSVYIENEFEDSILDIQSESDGE